MTESAEKNSGKDVKVTHIQKLIAERMVLSKKTKPCFYLGRKADVTGLTGMRHQLKKRFGVKITTNNFYILALARAVRKFPLIIARFQSDRVVIPEDINVGFAVNAPHGLVVPVIKNADTKTLAELALAEKELTDKARSNTLSLSDIENETIALSNLGAYDIDSFIAIIPPAASAILSAGKIIPSVVVIDSKPVNRKIVPFNMAFDHRVINGSYAAEFLGTVIEYLQDPQQLVETSD